MIKVIDAAQRLAMTLPDEKSPGYYRHYARIEIEELRKEMRSYMDALQHGELVITRDEAGNAVAVSLQDKEHRILALLWEKG